MGNNKWHLFKKQQMIIEAMASSKLEGADDKGMIKKADKLDLWDWFEELKKYFPSLYDEVFN